MKRRIRRQIPSGVYTGASVAPVVFGFGVTVAVALGAAGLERTDEGFLYAGPDTLIRVVFDANGVKTVLQSIPTGGFVEDIEEDLAHVYFVAPDGTLRQARIDTDAEGSVPLAHGVDPTSALQADGTCVYWIDAAAQAIMMVRS